MSLIVSANTKSKKEQVPEGTYLGVCNMLVDVGFQYSEKFKKWIPTVYIGWELPEVKDTYDGEERPRLINKQYSISFGENATLRKDLAAWRGRDFTQEELAKFDLKNIVGTSCFVNVIHNDNGYAKVNSVMALPKGMKKGILSESATVFDIDDCTLDDIENLPTWLSDIVKKSRNYEEMMAAPAAIEEYVDELNEEGGLPF